MPSGILKPDLKAIVWAAIGFLVVPAAAKFIRR
jgi:hypothetical protein